MGEKDFAVVDFSELYSKLKIGNRIIVDFGAVCLSVIGFEDESDFLLRRQVDDVWLYNKLCLVARWKYGPSNIAEFLRVETAAQTSNGPDQ